MPKKGSWPTWSAFGTTNAEAVEGSHLADGCRKCQARLDVVGDFLPRFRGRRDGPALGLRIAGGSDAYRPARSPGRKRPPEALWWHRAGSRLACRRVGRARSSGHALRERRFTDARRAARGVATRAPSGQKGHRPELRLCVAVGSNSEASERFRCDPRSHRLAAASAAQSPGRAVSHDHARTA